MLNPIPELAVTERIMVKPTSKNALVRRASLAVHQAAGLFPAAGPLPPAARPLGVAAGLGTDRPPGSAPTRDRRPQCRLRGPLCLAGSLTGRPGKVCASMLAGTSTPAKRSIVAVTSRNSTRSLETVPFFISGIPGTRTMSDYGSVEVSAGGVDVTYVMDRAEIPTLQEMESVDENGDG